jgi:glycosyltransferase involved in cell wall biosynthesis
LAGSLATKVLNMSVISVSAVIPSIGRVSLKTAIDSALAQSYPLQEVIVVLNGQEDFQTLIDSFPSDDRLKIMQLKNAGVAAARNAGVNATTSEFVAFLDDDDFWYPNKIETQLRNNLSRHFDILSCRAKFEGRSEKIKPKYLLENQDLLLKIYGQKPPTSRNYGIPTPSAIVRTQLARKFPFDEKLLEREDLWFFHTLLKNGAKLRQIPDVLLTVNSRKLSGDRNVTLESDLLWFSKLESVKKNLGWSFLLSVGLRNRIAAGKPFSALKLFLLALKH